ncbi:Cyclopropane-fatty-acyl-phospholipid synthase [Alloactinosynnema sp. L-07]|uniref:SAM-dependent methyltransferase n=1 Tax=Alloactinosynnema sp. L-07 TaxID=1653480 RepID=UPI00065EF499|nr:cyclopropane-fatty-acyl-phospholipid synthase family protein [Alloactinosynnema sp. L-07]CRK57686.1 Cyclopropane-fatty-acyl-phospholipid synthase [Alloactinosynnema sp. L-07]
MADTATNARRLGLATAIAEVTRSALGASFPLRVRTWDGDVAGPSDGPEIVVKSPRAVRHVLRSPGRLGLARAFVAGDLDVDGDLGQALRSCRKYADQVRVSGPPGFTRWPAMVALAVRLGAIGVPPRKPAEEVSVRGRRNSKGRDRAAIAHHYDLGNDFYETILDQSMAYSCAAWSRPAPEQGLAEAQHDKLDLICRKLDLQPGTRLLDVGCGWGSLVLHAARHHGVLATGITLSAQQHDFVLARAVELGVADLVEVRLQDYRDLSGQSFDAVASIEMGEHVGERNYPTYCALLRDSVRQGGRLLVQQMSRDGRSPGGGAFIESYIAPDMTMRPLHRTLEHLEDVGLEIRAVESLREDYVHTINAWAKRLQDQWDDVLHRFGARQARMWRLYLAGSALAFEENRMSVHQILAVRPGGDGRSGFPLGRLAGRAEATR